MGWWSDGTKADEGACVPGDGVGADVSSLAPWFCDRGVVFMRAREYFETARAAAKELQAVTERIERLRSAAELKTQRFERVSSGGGDGAALALLEADDGHAEELKAVVDEAAHVLYGVKGRGGVSKRFGSHYADAVLGLYLMLTPVDELAERLRVSAVMVERLAALAFMKIDAEGLETFTDS